MNTKYILPAMLLGVLLFGGIATVNATANLAEIPTFSETRRIIETGSLIEKEEFKIEENEIPSSYEETKKLMRYSIENDELIITPDSSSSEEVTKIDGYRGTRRFLMYTQDGRNILWGTLRNGYFLAQDNEGNDAWGVYQGGKFVGFYEEEEDSVFYFHGYYRKGYWKAQNLFGEESSYGKYVIFPNSNIRHWKIRPNPVRPLYYPGPMEETIEKEVI